MFKGTDSRSAADVDRGFDDIGARHNAFTSSEITAFWAHGLPESLQASQEILADILRPSLRPEDFDQEKGVILEEIAMYEDQPFWRLYERGMEVYYGKNRLSHRVLGTKKTITDLTCDQMVTYFQDRYSADNTIVALAGNLDFDRVVAQLQRECGAWEATGTTRTHDPLGVAAATFTDHDPSISQHYLMMAAPAPSLQDDRRYAAGVLTTILGHSEGSRLFWALVDPGIAEEAVTQFDGHDGTGTYLTWCCCSPQNSEQAEEIILEQIGGVVDSVTEDDLVRVRNIVATAATLQGELPAGRMQRLGRIMTLLGKYTSLEEELAAINAVTLDDVRQVACDFPLTPIVTGRLSGE